MVLLIFLEEMFLVPVVGNVTAQTICSKPCSVVILEYVAMSFNVIGRIEAPQVISYISS